MIATTTTTTATTTKCNFSYTAEWQVADCALCKVLGSGTASQSSGSVQIANRSATPAQLPEDNTSTTVAALMAHAVAAARLHRMSRGDRTISVDRMISVGGGPVDHDAAAKAIRGRRQCRWCDEVLSSGAALRRHQLVHSGRRPWSCGHCAVRFSLKYNCARHCRQRHPGLPSLVVPTRSDSFAEWRYALLRGTHCTASERCHQRCPHNGGNYSAVSSQRGSGAQPLPPTHFLPLWLLKTRLAIPHVHRVHKKVSQKFFLIIISDVVNKFPSHLAVALAIKCLTVRLKIIHFTCTEVSGVENIGQCGRWSQLCWLLGAL